MAAGEARQEQWNAEPDDGKPQSPTELTKPSMFYVLRTTGRQFGRDQCTDLAAALTYYAVLSLFPALLVMVTLLGLVLAAVAAFMLAVSGPVAKAIGDAIGAGHLALTVWSIVRWPVILAFVIVVVAILYYATPNIQQPKFRWISVGAAVAIVVWVAASVLFALYVSNFGSYNKTYGTLAGVIVFLLWLWITNLALLFGAELDAELERGRELQAGLPAERDLQLPPRDTRDIEKNQAKDERIVERAEKLRRSRGREE
jgi:membrane protein